MKNCYEINFRSPCNHKNSVLGSSVKNKIISYSLYFALYLIILLFVNKKNANSMTRRWRKTNKYFLFSEKIKLCMLWQLLFEFILIFFIIVSMSFYLEVTRYESDI